MWSPLMISLWCRCGILVWRLLAGGNRLVSQISVRTQPSPRPHTMSVLALLLLVLVNVHGETFTVGYLAGEQRSEVEEVSLLMWREQTERGSRRLRGARTEDQWSTWSGGTAGKPGAPLLRSQVTSHLTLSSQYIPLCETLPLFSRWLL